MALGTPDSVSYTHLDVYKRQEEEYVNNTLEEGWQHCLTVPRELKYCNGKVYQYPVEELMNLRRWKKKLCDADRETETDGAFDLELQVQKGPCLLYTSRCV